MKSHLAQTVLIRSSSDCSRRIAHLKRLEDKLDKIILHIAGVQSSALPLGRRPPKQARETPRNGTEARDTAAFNVNDDVRASLGATEAQDTAAFNASDKEPVTRDLMGSRSARSLSATRSTGGGTATNQRPRGSCDYEAGCHR